MEEQSMSVRCDETWIDSEYLDNWGYEAARKKMHQPRYHASSVRAGSCGSHLQRDDLVEHLQACRFAVHLEGVLEGSVGEHRAVVKEFFVQPHLHVHAHRTDN
jgi:hypothetical protein